MRSANHIVLTLHFPSLTSYTRNALEKMSSSAGLLSPRGPFSGAAPLALRPLSAIAATNAGGVPQSRIKRLLADLVPDLTQLHDQGDICGDVSLDSVGMDEFARAHILIEFTRPRRQRASISPMAGFAPFELYTDATQWPRGPWTDVYSLSAIAYALVTGERPPAAPERMTSDQYQPLTQRGLEKYEDDFLRAIDQGLALRPEDRPQSISAFSARLALPETVQPSQSMPSVPSPQTQGAVADAIPVGEHARRRYSPWILGVLVLFLLAFGAFWWFSGDRLLSNSLITRSELVAPTATPPGALGPLASTPSDAPGGAVGQTSTAVPHAFEGKAEADAAAAAAAPSVVAPAAAPAIPGSIAPAAAQLAPEVAAVSEDAPKPKPATVAVRVDIRPWGEVWINGVARGVSPPVKELRLAPGKYNVVVRNADLPPYRLSLDVKPGKPAAIVHVFK